MEPAFQFTVSQVAAYIVTIGIMILFPVAAAIIAHRRLGVRWRIFWYGAFVFFISQMLLRIPLVTALQALVGPQLMESEGLQLAFFAFLAMTAGLFEEVGRYLGYRWLFKGEPKTWAKGIMYGLGHGGLESIALVATLSVAQMVTLMTMTVDQLNELPATVQAQLVEQVNAPAWLIMAGAWERIWAITFHVAMSVLVLQVFRRGQSRWLWYAILLHALLDFSIAVPGLFGIEGTTRLLVLEGAFALFGLFGLWLIGRLRPSAGAVEGDAMQGEGGARIDAGSPSG